MPDTPLAVARRVDAACCQFEAAWHAGTPPRIEDVLAAATAADHPLLLPELIRIELFHRRRRGDRPRFDEYHPRFADLDSAWLAGEIVPTPDTGEITQPGRVEPTLSPDHEAATGDYAPGPEPGPPSIPGYEVRSVLGRGGMGVVYRARQVNLNREVALKTISRADLDPGSVARFWAEAEAMAAVKHPHVVQVFELGEHAGRPFLAMEYVAGGSLAETLKADGRKGEPPMSARAAAVLLEKVARGVAAAHDLGIVHRDLKPANVLLDAADEPKVSDFGLAKRLSHDLTRTSALMGTPAYMAPEQAAMRAKFVGPPADVWALGVILYECLSGQRPFVGGSVDEVLSRITSAEPAVLRGVPRDLATIVTKCLAKEPEYRYPTAGELADDLGRFVRGEPIAARPVGTAERLVRWVRRKPTAATAWGVSTLAVGLALVVFVVGGLWREAEGAKREAETTRDALAIEKKQTEDARDEAISLQGLADAAKNKAEIALKGESAAKVNEARLREELARVNYARTVDLAFREWKENNPARARELLLECRADLRGWEWRYIDRLCRADTVELKGHSNGVRSARFSPDGTRVVTAGNDATARVWEAATGREIAVLRGHTKLVFSAVFSPDGKRILTTGQDFSVRLWDADGRQTAIFSVANKSVTRAGFNPAGTRIVTNSSDYAVRIWDTSGGQPLVAIRGHTAAVRSAEFSRDGQRLLTASNDGSIRIWDVSSGQQLSAFTGHTGPVASASYSADEKWVVSASDDMTARVWNVAKGSEHVVLRGHGSAVESAAFSPDGTRIVTHGLDRSIRLWRRDTGQQLQLITGHTAFINGVAFDPAGQRLVSTSSDKTVRLWDVGTGRELGAFRAHTGSVSSAVFDPAGVRIATAGLDGTAYVWTPEARPEFTTLRGQRGRTRMAEFSSDGRRVLAADLEGPARIWDVESGAVLKEFLGHPRSVNWAAFSPDGRRIVTTGRDDIARIWDVESATEQRVIRGHVGNLYWAAFSPDGRRIVTLGGDNTFRLWDAESGTLRHTFEGHKAGSSRAAFSPDGRRMIVPTVSEAIFVVWDLDANTAVCTLRGHTLNIHSAVFHPNRSRVMTTGQDGSSRVWNSQTGEQLALCRGSVNGVSTAVYSPDGTIAVSAGKDMTARVWNPETGAEIHSLRGHRGEISSVAFSPDGSRIVTAGQDSTVRVWDVRAGTELLALKAGAPGWMTVSFSPDGHRLLLSTVSGPVLWDGRPMK